VILAGIALPQAGDFSAAKIFAWIIFGSVGFAVFLYGKKSDMLRPMIIGIALMVYPYFISGTALLYIIGAVLTAALYFWRE
jgi:hypothetical protein